MKDRIFLLSLEEYEKYKDNIPHCNCWWWLRSQGYCKNTCARVIGNHGHAGNYATVDRSCGGVLPALHVDTDITSIGERIVVASFPWIIIDKGLAIAETPIAFRRFDAKSTDYEKSEIRQFLLDWLKEREER